MSPLRSLFQPKWQHKNPEIRDKAVSRLGDPELLVKILRSDPEPAIKARALAQIDDPDTLDNLIANPDSLTDNLFRQAVDQRLKQLLPNPDAITTISQIEILTRIAALSDNPEIVASAIGQIADQSKRLDIALNHESAKVRLLAAQGINEMPLLKQLAEASRGKDKSLYRYCKTQIEQRDAGEKLQEQQQKQITALIDTARQLSLSEDAPDYRGRYLGLRHQWQSLSAIVSDIQASRFENYMTTCAKHLAGLAEAATLEQQHQQIISSAENIFASLIEDCERLELPHAEQMSKPDINPLKNLLADIERRWQDANRTTDPSDAQAVRYNSLKHGWRQMLSTLTQLSESGAKIEKWLGQASVVDSKDYVRLHQLDKSANDLVRKFPWPNDATYPKPDQLQALVNQHERLKRVIGELSSQQKQHIAQLQHLLDLLEEALAENSSKKAETTHGRVRLCLKAIDPNLRGNAEERIRALGARLQDMKDWKGFALEPKKLELCQRMEALCDAEIDPETLADQIQILQNQWKQLGSLPDKRREQDLWARFKAISDRAWEPCATAFARQTEVKKSNHRARMKLVAQLRDYEQSMAWPDTQTGPVFSAIDGELTSDQEPEHSIKPEHIASSDAKPDWPLVQQTLDTARAAFEQLAPVNHADDQSSRREFRKICNRIYGHIQAEYQRNILAKETLIAQANSLVALPDLEQAIEQAKLLQGQWKAIGLTPKSADRKLWQAFRAPCDALFNRLEEQKLQRRAEIDEKIRQAENLLSQAQALFTHNQDQAPARRITDIQRNIAEFNELDLPSHVHTRLRKQFSLLEKRAQEAITTLRRAKDNAQWRCLIHKIGACALQATDKEKALDLWANPDPLPADLDRAALESYWDEGPTTASEDACREACISLEIAVGLDSPAEDKQARMELQMQRLVKGSGHKLAQDSSTPIDIANRFISLRPSADWVRRFCQSLEKLPLRN